MAKAVFLVEAGHGEKRRTGGGNESGRKWRLDRGTGEGRSRGGLKAVNAAEGRNIGSTCSFAEAGPQEDAKCSESDFSDFVQPDESNSTTQLSLWKRSEMKDK